MFIRIILITINISNYDSNKVFIQPLLLVKLHFMQSIVITVEGNMMATDGNKQFSISINNGTNYIAGGTLGEDQYYATLQITVEEDDGKTYIG